MILSFLHVAATVKPAYMVLFGINWCFLVFLWYYLELMSGIIWNYFPLGIAIPTLICYNICVFINFNNPDTPKT